MGGTGYEKLVMRGADERDGCYWRVVGRNGGGHGLGIVKRANVSIIGGSDHEDLAEFIVRYRRRSEDIVQTQVADKTGKIPSLREEYLSFFEGALPTRCIQYRGFLPAST